MEFKAIDMLSFGWNKFKERPWFIIGALLVIFIISSLSSAIVDEVSRGGANGLTIVLGLIDFLVIQMLVGMGLVNFGLKAHDGIQNVQLRDLWRPAHYFSYVAATIVVAIIVTIGFVLLIVPGVIAAIGLMFTPYLVVERGLAPIAAIKESWRMTEGKKVKLFWIMLMLIGINIAGALLFGVGLIVSVPVSLLATVHAFRTLHAA